MKIAVRSTPSTSQKRSAEPSRSLIRLVAPTGMTKNSPTASTSEKTIVSPQVKPPISSSSSSSASCALAEIARARKPILSDSASATTPRITGKRRIRLRFAQETSGSEVTSISPSGVRQATAQVETPRIITPSSTAWPPTGASPDGDRLAVRHPLGLRRRPRARPVHRGIDGPEAQRARLAARRRNRSTRPPVSTSFCLPV